MTRFSSTSFSWTARAVAGLLAGLLLTLGVVSVSPSPARAASDIPLPIEVTGRGWGHGRGLGQWGAQGYAVDHGWTSAQILDHYYGGTTSGPIPASAPVNPNALRVELRSQRNSTLRADLASGTIKVQTTAGAPVAELTGAVRLVPADEGGTVVFSAGSCSGPWEEVARSSSAVLDLVPVSSASGSNRLLRVCHNDSSSTWYPGYLRFEGALGRTVNITTIEDYIRGVVPNEVPASWSPAALQAQAVAARSYAMAGDTRQQPYADTCDTALCQVYRGHYRQTASRGFSAATHPNTDAAIAATANLVRLRGSGVARTEFSSSTGGHTAGGSFPAVVDEGDDTAANPHHTWSTTVNLRGLVDQHAKGQLTEIRLSRNGIGPDGGRVTSARFIYTGGEVTMTGHEVRRALGLKSDWFTFGPVPIPDTAIAAYVDSVYRTFIGRSATDEELTSWTARLADGTSRSVLTAAVAGSDEWAGVMVDDLYRTVMGRPSDAGGRAFWLGRMAAGTRFASIAAEFYGAPEYFARNGGTNEAFVRALYRDILGRSPDPGGLRHWVEELDSGRRTRAGVAAGFYGSIESRADRVTVLYNRILGRSPDASGLAYWAERLLVEDDVRLAAVLATSTEYFNRSQG